MIRTLIQSLTNATCAEVASVFIIFAGTFAFLAMGA